jgi:hypothetical protein
MEQPVGMDCCESQVPPKAGDTRYAEIKAVENKMARSIFQTCHSMKAVASKENQMRRCQKQPKQSYLYADLCYPLGRIRCPRAARLRRGKKILSVESTGLDSERTEALELQILMKETCLRVFCEVRWRTVEECHAFVVPALPGQSWGSWGICHN